MSGSVRPVVAPCEPVKTATTLPLADAAQRLRKRPGRPRRHDSSHGHTGPTEELHAVAAEHTTGPSVRGTKAPIAPRLLDLKRAAGYLGVSDWTVRELVKLGQLRRVQLVGVKRVLLDRFELDRLVERSMAVP